MKKTILLLVIALGAGPALAQSFYLSVDNPSDLGPNTYVPTEILRNNTGSYATMLGLPDDAAVTALHRTGNGHWLFSVDAPADLAGFFEPRDVIRRDNSGAYLMEFHGQTEGVPAGASVDAVYVESGQLVLSFDVPVDLAGVTYLPADLVRHHGGGLFSLEFDSQAAGVPVSSNVTGADVRGDIIMTFDVPTDTPSGQFLPGDLVRFGGGSFSLYYAEATWPPASNADSLSFLAAPGTVQASLVLGKASATTLSLSWTGSNCEGGVDDYAIYRGTLGSWYSHSCHVSGDTDGVALSETVAMGSSADDFYYLVVAYNANDEGSYGVDSAGTERPMGAPTCNGLLTQELGCP